MIKFRILILTALMLSGALTAMVNPLGQTIEQAPTIIVSDREFRGILAPLAKQAADKHGMTLQKFVHYKLSEAGLMDEDSLPKLIKAGESITKNKSASGILSANLSALTALSSSEGIRELNDNLEGLSLDMQKEVYEAISAALKNFDHQFDDESIDGVRKVIRGKALS